VVADDTSLAWIGYRVSGVATFADSAQVTFGMRDSVIGLAVQLVPPHGTRGTLSLRAFARNREGVLAEVDMAESPARIVPASENIGSGHAFAAADQVYDVRPPGNTRRITADRESPSVTTTEGTFRYQYALPAFASGVDVTDNDSIFAVTLPSLDAVGLLDIRGASATLRLIQDTITTPEGSPCRVAALRDNQLLVARCTVAMGTNYAIVDAVAGTQTPRPDLVPQGGMGRTPDWRLAFLWDTSGAPTRVQVYLPESGTAGTVASLPWRSGPSAGTDRLGSFLAIGNAVLILPTLQEDQRYRLPGSGMTLPSPDGVTLLRFTSQGLLRLRRIDGLPHDLLLGVGHAGRWFITPDGRRVQLASGDYVDLPPLAPVINLRQDAPAEAQRTDGWEVRTIQVPCVRGQPCAQPGKAGP
jgi:hypothetical protein